MNKLFLTFFLLMSSQTVNAYVGKFLAVGMNPSAQRLSPNFGSSQDVLGGGGEIEFGKRTGGFEYSGVLNVSSGEAKSIQKNLAGENYKFGANTQSLGLGMRFKYRTANNFYLFITPQLRAVVIDDNGANEPEDETTATAGQIYDLEESYLGYGGDVGIGYLQSLNNNYVEDIYYQLSYSVSNYVKNYGEYYNGQEKVKINRSVGSNYYDQSILLTVGFTFGDSIVEQGKKAYRAVRSRW